jgi:hypothetical protein
MGLSAGTDGTYASQQIISNFFFTPLPELAVQPQGKNTLISWAEAPAPGFVLQENTTIGTTNWMNVIATPTLTNGEYQVIVPLSLSAQFYRLSLP